VDTHHNSARTCVRLFILLQALTAFQKEEVKIVDLRMVLRALGGTVVLCIPLTFSRRERDSTIHFQVCLE